MALVRALRLLVVVIAAEGALAAQSGQPPKLVEPRFSIAISVDSSTVKTGSQITTKAVLTNKAKDTIFLDTFAQWTGELDLEVEVRDVQGNLAPLTDYGRLVIKGEGDVPIVGKVFSMALLPGEVLKKDVVISKLYDLSQPGKYTIQAQRVDDANGALAKSNTVTVTVTP